MRISILCQFEAETACGIHMNGKAEAFASLGYQVHLVHHPFKFKQIKTSVIGEPNGGVRFSVLYSPFFENTKSRIKKVLRMLPLCKDVYTVLKICRQSDLLLIHKALPMGAFYLFLINLMRYKGKTVVILDDWEGIGGMATLRQGPNTFNKLLASWAEEYMPHHCSYSMCAAQIIVERLKLSQIPDERIRYVPLGGASQPKPKEIPDSGKTFVVGYVGTYKSVHHIAFLTSVVQQSLKRSKKFRFVFIGGGDGFAQFKERLQPFEKYVELTGQIQHQAVMRRLAQFHACMLYLNDEFPENYLDASRSSTKMFEYMAMEKAIVATKHGEAIPVLTEHAACLVPNTPHAFAEALKLLLDDEKKRVQLGQKARRRFTSKFSHKILMREFLKSLE